METQQLLYHLQVPYQSAWWLEAQLRHRKLNGVAIRDRYRRSIAINSSLIRFDAM